MPDEHGKIPDLRIAIDYGAELERERNSPLTRAGQLAGINAPITPLELTARVNSALAEAAMARQETAAQSARIDGVHEEIRAATGRAYEHASKMCSSLDKQLQRLEEGIAGQSAIRMQSLEDGLNEVRQFILHLPAPKLAVPTPTEESFELAILLSDLEKIQKHYSSTSWEAKTLVQAVRILKNG